MLGFSKAALHKLQHPPPTLPENAPHAWSPRIYGAKTQYIEEHQDIPLIPQKDVQGIQQLAGTVLHYVRSVDPTLILPVNVLASEQTQATATTADKVIKLLNYCATAKTGAEGFFYMGSNIDSKNKLTNGAILIIDKILKDVMS
jgi:hypothetical protein